MISPWDAAAIATLGALVYKATLWIRNIRLAQATGLPWTWTPILETEFLGFCLTPLLRALYHRYLDKGEGWPRWCRLVIKDWQWEDKRRAHDEYGDVFLCVAPHGIICYCADAAMAWDVMNRRYDFTKPMDKYKLLEPYGPNVATTEGKNYQFHVRITAPPFGDISGVNSLVWRETLRQTEVLCEAWSKESSRSLSGDLNALTLSVISLAGFGKQIDWAASDETHQEIPQGYVMSFLKAISDTTGYMVAILLFPGWLLRWSPLKKANDAHVELDKYLREMIRNERARIAVGRSADTERVAARGNLLTSLLEASHSEARSSNKGPDGVQKRAFTEDEVMGNLFIYLLAGYETTANSIYYGLALLALRPDIQDKTIAEIDQVYKGAREEGRSELTYEQDFEKLHYLYGFMYETFRLYPGVLLITKMVSTPQRISVSLGGDKLSSHMLPPETRVYLNTPAVHYSENYWPNANELNPHRWMPEHKVGTANKKVVAADRTRHMRGTLLTFSDGARSCLGRKFAQAEYIAFLTALLRKYRVELAPGQDIEAVRRDLDYKCAGKVTLAPLDTLRLTLKPRERSK
ncbi:putative TPA: cytochrome P450 oxidoreductase [Aureobasidium namibiae CBS 147.97]|uniref:Putative TPA: cytochrome P450 oxidoreductase n=1 Tax=Aureobasidium namibiae CBS 147.97 TaxID=1043004 RepID=A0A074XKQ7_9PEZI|nr:putative cytochrome P450 oxidoreductase [Aureobasidium namibiae CBS 147.97]KEQ75116.1 putative TPA: cytochrome P450 oxidoreductase [Aureobasidium namibiae CBS 147.97]